MKKIAILFCVGFLFLGFATSASATTYNWVGGVVNSNTSNPQNWNTSAGICATSTNATMPTTTDTINFVSNCVNNATIDSALSVSSFNMNTGYSGTVTNSTSLTVANGVTMDAGTFNVTNGGTVNSLGISIGNGAGSSATSTIDGASSMWTSSGIITIGASGTGKLTISNGGVASTTTVISIRIGANAGSNGTVIVDGSGSALKTSSYLQVGRSGTGTMTISNGGTVVSNSFSSGPGSNAGSFGTVTIDGVGSTWSNGVGSSFSVGNSGTGIMTISNGGVLNSTTGLIGSAVGSSGTVTISGTGSTWTASNDFAVGNSGTGTLTVQNNGGVNLTGTTGGTKKFIVANNVGSTGTFNIGAGGISGTLQAATTTGGSGTSTINFNHTDTSYTFSPQITGALKVNHTGTGTTTLSGANSYTGTTTLSAGTLVASNTTAFGTGPLVLTAGILSIPSGNLNITGNWTNNGATVNPGASTVVLIGTSQIITGTNTFYNFTINAPHTVTFPSGVTQTFSGLFTALGTLGNIITINASTPGSPATLSKSSGTVNSDYLSITDSTATGGATWIAGGINSTNVSGNTGWIFDTTAPTITSISASVSLTGASIFWSNNEVSSSTLQYGSTTSYGTQVATTSATTTIISGLSTCSTYNYQITSWDALSNTATSSNNTFRTLCRHYHPNVVQDISISTTTDPGLIQVIFLATTTEQVSTTTVLGSSTTSTTQPVSESQVTTNDIELSNLINLLISLGIIDASKADIVRTIIQQSNTNTAYVFNHDFKYRQTDSGVRELQKFLNTHGFTISITGAGSIGLESNYFGLKTQNALKEFQKANNITPAVGYFGIKTRAVVNKILSIF